VQEFIEGQDLFKDSCSRSYQEADIIQILQELLPALQFIHEAKVLHRDIKPENIMRRRVAKKIAGTKEVRELVLS